MKITLILFAMNLVTVVQSDVRTARHIDYHNNGAQVPPCKLGPKPVGFKCRDLKEEPSDRQPHCKEPCQYLPDVKRKDFSEVVPQKVTEKLLLTCTPDSFYDSIVLDASFEDNVSCNAVIKKCLNNLKEFYTGIKTLPNRQKVTHSLPAKTYCNVISFTNGNVMLNERAILNDCECEGDVLSTISQWVADDPISGCRGCGPGDGVKESTAVAFKLKIFGKCCSECNLQSGKVWFSKGIKNH